MNNNFENINKKETMTDLYNAYGLITEGVSEEKGKIVLSEGLQNEGWKIGPSFRDTNDHVKYVKDEVETGKNFYEFKIAIVKDEPFAHTRCLLFREKNNTK